MDKQHNEILLSVLEKRGIGADEMEEFLSAAPQLTYDPFLLSDMRAGVDLLLSEIDQGSRIIIYGDYDVDGVTSTALMVKALRVFTDNIDYYIPSRIDEGYGLNKDAIKKIAESGGDVIITVDCGAVSMDETEYASSLGIRTIVTDHHNVGENMASGIVIDPRRPGDAYPFKGLAGVGVAYKFIQAISKVRDVPREMMTELLELVAVGTIADVMPLTDENRTMVKYGLRLIRLGCRNAGLRRLIELSGMDTASIKAGGISFGIAPRINSAGRMGDAALGVKMLLAEDRDEVERYCTSLIEMNQRRRTLQDEAYKQCREKADAELEKGDFLLVEAVDVHEGVLGIVAGRIKEDLNRPVVIVSESGDAYKGTGRSIGSVDMFSMLSKYRERFIRFGGHSAACGFMIDKVDIDGLRTDLNHDMAELCASNENIFQMERRSDCTIDDSGDITLDLAEELELLEPCGHGNPAPLIEIPGAIIDSWRYLKNDTKYAKLRLGKLDCLLFRDAGEYYGAYVEQKPVTIIGTPEINVWNGNRRVQFRIDNIDIMEEGK